MTVIGGFGMTDLETQANSENVNLSLEIDKLRVEKLQLQEQLLKSYKNELRLLHQYKSILRKYEALRQSKLGKLTLFYWKNKRKIFGGN